MSEKKQTILEWYQENQMFIDAPCNGMGNCGRCKVKFVSDAPVPKEKEKELLSEAELKEGIRLACVTVMEEDLQFEPLGVLVSTEQMVIPEGTDKKGSTTENAEKIKENEPVGIAVDIGTTTLAMAVNSLVSGKCIKVMTMVNSQRTFGADVISRIQAANQGKGRQLQQSILMDIWKMLQELIVATGMKPEQIKKIVIAGNTTMCHLLLGYSCERLGSAPFVTQHNKLRKLEVKQFFAEILPLIEEDEYYVDFFPEVIILPAISAFVGADIVAGVYYCDMDLQEEPQMLLDIGTNGEIVIGDKKGFYVTSTAAGPVFEGGNISCGIPAVKGAIAHAVLENTEELHWNCEILGGAAECKKAPVGICGSGLIDCVAALWQEGIIDENGTLIDCFFETGVPVNQLRITQSDIREVQMGKAAIRAGIEVLMEKESVEKLYLAGGFGTELNIASAITIGLLPEDSRNCVISKGNTSLKGLQKFLMDKSGEERIWDIIQKSKEIVLAKEGNFEEKYILFMQFLI